jgi:phospholipid/cholesterol/gamma-HCH transport system ATP-binding protein
VIRLQSVYKSFNSKPVLKGVDLHVTEGETKIILGGSGSGKSTILKLILGLEKPDSGSIIVEGEEITNLSEVEMMPIRNKIGVVFQEGALFDSLTVGENTAYRLREGNRVSETEIVRTVQRLLGFVGLENAIDKMPAELSGGMRRRAAIARALAGSPKIMLYDEATAGLDPITSRVICELMIKLRDLENVSSIFVTHHLEAAFLLASQYARRTPEGRTLFLNEANEMCLVNTKFLVMEDGRIIAEGTDEELRQSRNSYVRDLID